MGTVRALDRRPWLLAAAWLLVGAGGIGWLTAYAGSPGRPARAPDAWPADSELARAADRPTLLFFAHPACPCTRASASELARLMARHGGAVSAQALVSVPDGVEVGWADTDVTAALEAIPGVRVVLDHGDREGARFGVATSGQVLLYDRDGRLRFRGGITAARGHAGDNACRDALERAIRGAPEGPRDVPVFGCALEAPDDEGDR